MKIFINYCSSNSNESYSNECENENWSHKKMFPSESDAMKTLPHLKFAKLL